MNNPAAQRGGAGSNKPAPPAFELIDHSPIHKGNLLGRVRLQMSSGLIVACNVVRARKDPESVFVLPVGERQQGGSFTPILDFATPQLREAWQASALAALRPRWSQIINPSSPKESSDYGNL